MNQLKIGTFLMVAYMAKKDREEDKIFCQQIWFNVPA